MPVVANVSCGEVRTTSSKSGDEKKKYRGVLAVERRGT